MNSRIASSQLWRNDITGLRAVAVIPVLLYHAFPQTLPGGFLGVDVFFVISGYLISGIIFRDLLSENFSYKRFYEKRIKRIIPNLLLLLTFVASIGFFILLPHEYENLGRHIYSSAAFIENFRLLKEVDYFTEDALRKPLLHLWSLAIEEQFYIIFPIIFAIIWKATRSKTIIGFAVFITIIGSLIGCFLCEDNSFRFYFPLTRFWEIGAGIILAYAERFHEFNPRKISVTLRHILSIIGLSAIIIPICTYSPNTPHPGLITILPIFGSISLITASSDALVNKTILSWRLITFIGLISYSLYLWHWPILSYLFICCPNLHTLPKIIALIISLLIASIIYFYIENPIRRAKDRFKIQNYIILIIGLVIAILIGQIIRKEDGLPFRPSNNGLKSVEAVRKIGEWDPYKASQKIEVYGSEMAITKPSTFPSTIFIGDSHIAQYYSRIKNITQEPVGFIASGGCMILTGEAPIDKTRCKKASNAVYKLMKDERVKVVVIGQKWGYDFYANQTSLRNAIEKFNKLISERSELKLFVLLDYPWADNYDPLLHYNRLSFKIDDFILPLPTEKAWSIGNSFIKKQISNKATFIDPTPTICPNGFCNLLKWYKDNNHLQPNRVESDATWLDIIFK